MSGRGLQASLSVQAEKLKKNIQNRDQRRRKEQNQRAVSLASLVRSVLKRSKEKPRPVRLQARSDQLDPYDKRPANNPSATGGVRLGPAAAALAAVADASALEGPIILRCEPCQVTTIHALQLIPHQHHLP